MREQFCRNCFDSSLQVDPNPLGLKEPDTIVFSVIDLSLAIGLGKEVITPSSVTLAVSNVPLDSYT